MDNLQSYTNTIDPFKATQLGKDLGLSRNDLAGMVSVSHDLVVITLQMLRICREQLNAELTGITIKLGDDFVAGARRN